MFVVYSITNIKGVLTIRDIDFMGADKNYIEVKGIKTNVESFLEYEKLKSIDYILPGNGVVDLKIQFNDYCQTAQGNSYDILEGTLANLDGISKDDIISGRMPDNEYEVVIDKVIYDNLIKDGRGTAQYKGITNAENLLGRKVFAGSLDNITIVGIVNKNAPSIYANKNVFVNLLNTYEDLQIAYGGYSRQNEYYSLKYSRLYFILRRHHSNKR